MDQSNSGVNGGSMGSADTSGMTENASCPTCGQSTNRNAALDHFLGRLGMSDVMINNLKTQFQNVNIDEYLETARVYLKDGSSKATAYAKENPGKVAAGVAALAVGAGVLYKSVKGR